MERRKTMIEEKWSGVNRSKTRYMVPSGKQGVVKF